VADPKLEEMASGLDRRDIEAVHDWLKVECPHMEGRLRHLCTLCWAEFHAAARREGAEQERARIEGRG
jgi:hypothetical protein